jgi:hypothetical protein
MSYTALDKLKEVEREIAQRIRFYPGMVERKTLTMEKATLQIAIMQAIAVDYFKIVERERRASELPLDDDRTTILSGG